MKDLLEKFVIIAKDTENVDACRELSSPVNVNSTVDIT